MSPLRPLSSRAASLAACAAVLVPSLATAAGALERFDLAPGSSFEAHTTSGGLLGKLGHPHRIRATAVTGEIALDRADPGRSSVEVVVGARGLEVATDADASDRETIEQGMHEDVLQTEAHPEIRFRSRSVAPTADGVRVTGDVTMAGSSAPASVDLATGWEESGALRLTGAFTLRLTDFGIDPPTALLGSIVVGDEVRIEIDALARPAGSRQTDRVGAPAVPTP